MINLRMRLLVWGLPLLLCSCLSWEPAHQPVPHITMSGVVEQVCRACETFTADRQSHEVDVLKVTLVTPSAYADNIMTLRVIIKNGNTAEQERKAYRRNRQITFPATQAGIDEMKALLQASQIRS